MCCKNNIHPARKVSKFTQEVDKYLLNAIVTSENSKRMIITLDKTREDKIMI